MTKENKKKKREEYLNSLEETIVRGEMTLEFYQHLEETTKDKQVKAQYGTKVEQLKREIGFNKQFVDFHNG